MAADKQELSELGDEHVVFPSMPLYVLWSKAIAESGTLIPGYLFVMMEAIMPQHLFRKRYCGKLHLQCLIVA